MKREESFGIIPLSKERGRWEVFLIQHRKGGYWGFPKGHAESRETPRQAASRELKEETNLTPVRYLLEDPLVEKYSFSKEGMRIVKQVFYFPAEVTGEAVLQKAEIEAGIWLSLPEALEKLTHPEGKSILSQVAKALPRI